MIMALKEFFVFVFFLKIRCARVEIEKIVISKFLAPFFSRGILIVKLC